LALDYEPRIGLFVPCAK